MKMRMSDSVVSYVQEKEARMMAGQEWNSTNPLTAIGGSCPKRYQKDLKCNEKA
jgi:hypothetical protein